MNNKLNTTHNITNENLALWSDDANPHVASAIICDELVHNPGGEI